ncbi:MAG: RES family NAD+ phosphorylase [Caulobacteraceae bacterium]|nr:RES family NAD+ phosphorylase [Caulobacteraceae bacterium]
MTTRRVRWRGARRIIASRYPPIDLFERVSADPSVWEALIALEALTNPRVRDETGVIALVPPEDRIFGPGASYVMSSFTHVNPKGSRFGDGRFGVYYAAADLRTALAETIHHFEAFARDAGDPPRAEDMRVLVGAIDHDFEDVVALPEAERTAVLDPDAYGASQAYGARLRQQGAAGVVYPSVRLAGGWCVGAFKPTAVQPPVQERHLQYRWNGERVDRYFDYAEDRWIGWPA